MLNPVSDLLKILLAAVISQCGSHFLTISLSAYVLVTTHSPVWAATVFVVSFFPSVLVSSKLGSWIDRTLSRRLVIRNELTAVITTGICGAILYFQWPIWILCGVLAIRSILLFISRSAFNKWIKLVAPAGKEGAWLKLFFLSFFLSTGLAGILAGYVLDQGTVLHVVGLDILTYLIGVSILIFLPRIPASEGTAPASVQRPAQAQTITLGDSLKEILSHPTIRRSFLWVCLSQAILQGAYSVLVSYLPIQKFQLSMGGTGYFQLAASLGILFGFVLIWARPKVLTSTTRSLVGRSGFMALASGLSLLLCAGAADLASSLAFFLLMNFTYECIWLYHMASFLEEAPKTSAARYSFVLTSSASFLMALVILVYAALVSQFGALIGVTGVLSIAAALALTSFFWKINSNTVPQKRGASL